MKIFVLVVLVFSLLIVAVYGSATALDVRGGTIQAGSAAVQVGVESGYVDDGVEIAGWELDPGTGMVQSICIGDIDDQNIGKEIHINILQDDCIIASGSGTIDGNEVCILLDFPVPMHAIEGIEVFISAGPG